MNAARKVLEQELKIFEQKFSESVQSKNTMLDRIM